MATLHRIRVALSGFPGQPGVTTFYAEDAPAFVNAIDTWISEVIERAPAGMKFSIENTGDIFESTTGEVSGVWTTALITPQVSTNANVYAAGVGYIVHWKSDTYLSGRLLRGRSFLVPCVGAVFSADGTLVDGDQAVIQTAATALVTAGVGNFAVWQRPRKAKAADGSRPAVTARVGGHANVVAATVPDKAVFLTSRRD